MKGLKNDMAQRIKSIINNQEMLADGIFSMWLNAPEIAKEAKPGQFVAIYANDSSKLLPRPISICETDKGNGRIRLVYRTIGAGTKEIAKYTSGEYLMVMGPLGNGFPLNNKSTLLIGGGIGIPPLLELAKNLTGEKTVILGYRDSNLFLKQDFQEYAKTLISTEDGSVGIKGTVMDVIKTTNPLIDTIYACGPTPMLRSLKLYSSENNVTCWISLEERMACGIGACLGCICQSRDIDTHSNVYNKRICKDGPVFLANDVDI